MIRTATFLAAGVFLTACGVASGPQTVSRLGSDPVLSGGSYDSGGGLTVAVDVQEYQGQTMVCGAWAQSDQQSILTKGKAKPRSRRAVDAQGHMVRASLRNLTTRNSA